jgi:hypothetical protein
VDDVEKLEALLELAETAELEIRSVGLRAQPAGEPPPTSGVCRVRDQVWVVLCAADPVERHLRVLAEALRAHRADFLEERFIPPALRQLL